MMNFTAFHTSIVMIRAILQPNSQLQTQVKNTVIVQKPSSASSPEEINKWGGKKLQLLQPSRTAPTHPIFSADK